VARLGSAEVNMADREQVLFTQAMSKGGPHIRCHPKTRLARLASSVHIGLEDNIMRSVQHRCVHSTISLLATRGNSRRAQQHVLDTWCFGLINRGSQVSQAWWGSGLLKLMTL
jgi:hypothetical protein